MRAADPPNDEQERLESLILAYDEALSRCEAELNQDLSELSESALSHLRGTQAALRMLEQARLCGLADDIVKTEPRDSLAEQNAEVAPNSVAGKRIGRFELIRELGRGGHGVVFLANDHQLGRQVALKIPRPEVLISAASRRRFAREAQAAGALSHPNLISVYEVGEEGAFCYLATAYSDGPTLTQWLRDQPGHVPERVAARLVRDLARGVQHAHERGVLHRDIKPSNILLERPSSTATTANEMQLVPRLTDFGLAKLLELSEDETCTGTLLGTPAYMAPEQAEGRMSGVASTTDVYSLGVILYELLAGRPPFRGESDVQTLHQVIHADVPRLAVLRPDVSRDLEAIVLRCLERTPGRRYATASALADDLQRFLSGEPTLARPAGSVERTLKWIRRRPSTAALVAVLVAAGTAMTAGGWWHSLQLRTAFDQLQTQKQETDHYLYAASLTLADQALKSNQISHAEEQLARWIPGAGEPDHRSFAWHYLWRQFHQVERTLTGHTGDIYCVRYSNDGRLMATASQDQTARIWDAATGKCLLVLKGHKGDVNCVAFNREGTLVATAGDDGTVRLWRTEDGRMTNNRRAHEGPAFGVAFSPIQPLVASCGRDCKVAIYNYSNKKQLPPLVAHGDSIGALAFLPDGRQLATASEDDNLLVWNLSSRKAERMLMHEGQINCLAISNDGKHLLTGQRTKRIVRHWDLSQELDETIEKKSGRAILKRTYDWVHAVACSPSNQHFALATKDGLVELGRISDGTILQQLPGHDARVWSVAFSPDGHRLATASADRMVKIWILPESTEIVHDSGAGNYVALTPDARMLARGDATGNVTVYDIANRTTHAILARDYDVVGDFNCDHQLDSGQFYQGTWRLLLSSRSDVSRTDASRERIVKFGTRDDVPVVGDWDGDGRDDLGCYRPTDGVWTFDLDGQGGEPEQSRHLGPLSCWPNERYIPVVGRWDSPDRDGIGLAVWEKANTWTFWLARGDRVFPCPTSNAIPSAMPLAGRWLCPRPDGWGFWKHDVTAKKDGVWFSALQPQGADLGAQDELLSQRVRSYQPIASTTIDQAALGAASDRSGLRHLGALALSPNGKLIALSMADDARVKVWDVHHQQRVSACRIGSGDVLALAFSPDGKVLSAGSNTGELMTFRTDGTIPARHVSAHQGRLLQLAYSPDGRQLATVGEAGDIKIWDQDGNLVSTLGNASVGMANCIVISPASDLVAVASANRVARVWQIATGEEIAVFAGHAKAVNGIAFSPDQRCLATVSDDGSIKLWDMTTRQELYTLDDGLGPLSVVVFSSTGLVTAGPRLEPDGLTGSLRVWSAK